MISLAIRNAVAHPILTSCTSIWLFWLAGYVPIMKKQWRTAHGLTVLLNILLCSFLLLRILGVA